MVLTLFHPHYNVKETVHFKEDLFSEFFVDALLCLKAEVYFCDNRISFRHVRSRICDYQSAIVGLHCCQIV